MSHYAHQNLSLVTQEWIPTYFRTPINFQKSFFLNLMKDKCSKCLSRHVLLGWNFCICLFGNGYFLVSTQIGSFIPYMDHYTDSDWASSQYFSNFMVPKQFQRNTYNQKNAICYVVQVKIVDYLLRIYDVIIFSGLRGAIAYAVSLHLDIADQDQRRAIITTSLCVVLFTILVLGGSTYPLVKWLKISASRWDYL